MRAIDFASAFYGKGLIFYFSLQSFGKGLILIFSPLPLSEGLIWFFTLPSFGKGLIFFFNFALSSSSKGLVLPCCYSVKAFK